MSIPDIRIPFLIVCHNQDTVIIGSTTILVGKLFL